MNIRDFLAPELIVHNLNVASRKRALESIASLFAKHYNFIDADQLFDKLLERERLGSTALGEGVAIPHCRMKIPSGTTTLIGAFANLEAAINFDAIDQKPVDIIFVLVAFGDQQRQHLDALAAVNSLAIDSNRLQQLREASNLDDLKQLLL